MAAHAPLSLLDRLRQRADALPLDRAPLRRAGLLTVLLIALLVLGKAFGPTPPRSADRQDVRSETEEVSAPQSSRAWTGGRVLAILFLVTGGGMAFWMHRRAGGRTVSFGSTLKGLETYPLGPGQSLRLVACGEEVLLLSVASEGATLLRHWPREAFEAEPVSFANALASLTSKETPTTTISTLQAPSSTPSAALPLPVEEDLARDEGHDELVTAPTRTPPTEHLTLETTPLASSADTKIGADALATAPSEPPPPIARGTLFPPRTHAPRQFDVRHG